MRIAVVHNALGDQSAPDEQDVLVQADAVTAALERLGHTTVRLTCDLNLSAVHRQLEAARPDLVFNLVESLAGTGRLLHLFPSLLDALGMPYAGASAEALFLTSNKTVAKQRLEAGGLATPAWVGPCDGRRLCKLPAREKWPERWIIKSVWEHASIGLDEKALVARADTPSLPERLRQRAPQLGGHCFAEAFVEGREFNLSVLDGPRGPQVLPAAEIIFEGYRDDQAKIVDYNAKWDDSSYAYHHTPRCFDFPADDVPLIDRLKALALACWELFDLGGYARVDFRVDSAGRPWVLEINANPCIAPDAGFAAAIERAGLTYDQAVERIIGAAGTRTGKNALGFFNGLTSAETRPVALSTAAIHPPTQAEPALQWRYALQPEDPEAIRHLVALTGFFNPEEIGVAEELVLERLAKGEASGYYFLMAELDGRLVGYSCYGPIAGSANSFDLYWIAVHPDVQRRGLGRRLMQESERLIYNAGGRRIYVETSGRAIYASTRIFYENCAYRLEAVLEDFYAPGDGKAIYCKVLS